MIIHRFNNQYYYYIAQMNFLGEDDFTFNVVSEKPINKQKTLFSKVDKKKQKYSITMREKNKKQFMSKDNLSGRTQQKYLPLLKQNNDEGSNTNRRKQYSGQRKSFQSKSKVNKDRKNYRTSQSQPMKIQIPQNIQVPQQLIKDKQQQALRIDCNSFQDYQLQAQLLQSLQRNNIQKLTDIQVKCYEDIFTKKDCIVKANTGSGKTLAYLIPLINNLIKNKVVQNRQIGTVVLVICPNRQLCIQGQKQAYRCLKRSPFIVPGCLMGGEQINHEKSRIRKGVVILFATPGRLIYHLKNTQSFKIDNLQTIVFQQADRTLDMGFHASITQIIQIIIKKKALSEIHKVLVSAHFNEKVKSLIKNLDMLDANYIGFDEQKKQEQQFGAKFQKQQINIPKNIKQKYVLVSQQERIPLLISYLSILRQQKVLIFVSTIDEVVYLDMLLTNLCYRDPNGVMTTQHIQKRPIFKLHGDLDQKLRSTTYFSFRKEKSAILISTQVAARGLDFPDLSHIILFDPPATFTDYGNRVGRGGRFNSTGVSLMILHYQQSDFVQKVRYYSPQLQSVNRDIILQGFADIIKKMNVGDNPLYYIQGIVRGLVKDDEQKYAVARKAYTSMLRAYARLPDKTIFIVKKLNLKLLARTFGLNSSKQQRSKSTNKQQRETNYHTLHKKRKVLDIKKLQVSQYL